MQKVYKK